MNSSHDSPARRFPRLILHNGPNKASTLHLAPGIKIMLTPSQTNIMLLLKNEWDEGNRLDPEDRGWINADRLIVGYKAITGRTIEKKSVNSYANRTKRRIEEVLKQHRSILPPLIERSIGQGIHLTTELTVLASDGDEWTASA